MRHPLHPATLHVALVHRVGGIMAGQRITDELRFHAVVLGDRAALRAAGFLALAYGGSGSSSAARSSPVERGKDV
ncbi:MAG: hypothetical protein DMG09_17500 [Acidobacteria bacterium]|nr:MAG: hypothetical protein DMG09_17500 [Acidobacteriota bacterium]